MMKLLSAADIEKKGELCYNDIVRSLNHLKTILVKNLMTHLGVSIQDMAISCTLSIAMLSLTLGLIFVGIEAFSPASSFSSVTNTMLPLGAGVAANQQPKPDAAKKPTK